MQISIDATGTTISVDAPDPTLLFPAYLLSQGREELMRVAALSNEAAADEIAGSLAWLAFGGSPERSWYLPAARSGLLQSHKMIAGSLIRRSSARRDGARLLLPGVVTDFLSEMVTLDAVEDGSFQDTAHELEQGVLNGRVDVVPVHPSAAEIRYRTASADLPLQRTSSMVSELAPVVLYLRHLLHEHDLLIVEEPEAHLHPESQAIFAQLLGGLANSRLAILLTTHSEFFLHQVNNLISASRVDPDTALDVGVRAGAALLPENVGAYGFTFGSHTDGTDVHELEVARETGVVESSFLRVAETLYDQSVAIDRADQA